MKLIKPTFEILNSKGLFEDIEIAARTCYQSQDKIMQGSAEKIVKNLIERGHLAMLEHGSVYFLIKDEYITKQIQIILDNALYTKINYIDRINEKGIYCEDAYVTTNYRVILENENFKFLKSYQCEPTEFHEKRVTVRFNTQIAISREFNRHRVDSIAESSTRYCNYSKDKFGNEITINAPHCVTEIELAQAHKICTEIAIKDDKFGTLYEKETYYWNAIDWWLWANACTELAYMKLIELGWQAQDARTILPLDTNTVLVHTAFVKDWEHFFMLRDAPTAHPDARALAHPLHEEFIKKGLING